MYFWGMNEQIGKFLVGLGVLLIAAGLLIWLFHDKLHWLGKLPGDLRVEGERFSFFFPVTTMILFSVAASFLVWLFRKLY